MLGRAAERFIRTKWPDVQTLAEELYACFSPDLPITASQITNNQAAGDTTPPFVVNRDPGSTGPSFQFNNNGGDTNFGGIDIHGANFGDVNFGPPNDYGLPFGGSTQSDLGGGGTDLSGLDFPGQNPGDASNAVPLPNFNPFMLYGEVVAKDAGSTHIVRCWAKSPLGGAPAIGVFLVRFPGVDPSETIPAGTPCPVLCFPGTNPINVNTILDAVGFVPTFFG